MTQLALVIDLNVCVGCHACVTSCKEWNTQGAAGPLADQSAYGADPSGTFFNRVQSFEVGEFPDTQTVHFPKSCLHCEDPPCVPVCPTGATWQRADGLVIQDYDVCIGCAYCAMACPYQARTIAHDQAWYYGAPTAQERAVAHEDRLGVAQKCTFCKDKVDDGLARGLTPGVDPEATPACSAACIAQAIHFGDFADPASNVARLVRDNPYFQLNAALGTDPQIKYLYSTPAVPGRDVATETAPDDDERASDPANPLVGPHQTLWDWRAAMNWIFGGVASGFAVMAYLGSDFSYLDLRRPAFDLTDRGVEGRASPDLIDAYLYTDRGVYRPGETVNVVTLLRDQQAKALGNTQLNYVLSRSDGLEAKKWVATKQDAGGISTPVTLTTTAPRGSTSASTWSSSPRWSGRPPIGSWTSSIIALTPR